MFSSVSHEVNNSTPQEIEFRLDSRVWVSLPEASRLYSAVQDLLRLRQPGIGIFVRPAITVIAHIACISFQRAIELVRSFIPSTVVVV